VSVGWPQPVSQMRFSRSNRHRTYAGIALLCGLSREQWVASYKKGARTLFGQEVLSEVPIQIPTLLAFEANSPI